MMEDTVKAGDLVLVTNRYETQQFAVGAGASCIVVCCGAHVSAQVKESAESRGCTIIATPYDTYAAARLICMSIPVRAKMIPEKATIKFSVNTAVDDAKKTIASSRHRFFPVIDENGKYVGLVNTPSLLSAKKKHVILVDHNERGQAVEGIEEAKILEIIDHHRLGGIQTSEPIFTHAEPVGCTATIVANMHWQNDVDIPASIAGLLLSAILSDTVLFKSPTCTPYDKKTAERLAEIAGVDIQEYGMAMLKAGSGIGDMTPAEIAKNDLKEFQIGDYRVIVSQISVMDPKEVMDIEPQLIEAMQNICDKEGFDLSLVMVTDILQEATYLLFTGSPKTLIGEAFKKDASGTHIYLPGVMSRKKQVIPPLSEAVKRLGKN